MVNQLRWGIIGSGPIVRDFVLAIRRAGLRRHRLVAIASKSSPDVAKEYASKFEIEKVYNDYDELIKSDEIDAVYIGLVHTQHFPVARAAIKAGKAVLCEKPLTTSLADTRTLIEESRLHKVLLVEAVWSAFCPLYARLRELLTTVQAVSLQVAFNLAFPERNPPRPDSPVTGFASAMWGIGIYAIHMVTVVFGASPLAITATGRLDANNVDRAEAISLTYKSSDGRQECRVASLLVDTQAGGPDECVAVIFCKPDQAGINVIRIGPKFWMPERLEIVKTDGTVVVENFPLPGVVDSKYANDKFAYFNSEGLAYEADAMADAFEQWKANGAIEHKLRPHEDSISDANIMETSLKMIRQQHGVKE